MDKETLSIIRKKNWFMVIFFLHIYMFTFWSLHLALSEATWKTLIYTLVLILLGSLGITAGAHRLWAHQSYKASLTLKIFLMLCHTLCGNGTIYDWVVCHRLHHKYYNTDLDPFNSKNGFLFAHLKGNLLKYSPAQEKALESIDVSDLEQDSVVMFQKKWYILLLLIVTFLVPINAPAEYWNESLLATAFVAGWLRWSVLLNMSFLVHSAYNIWGLQPGEKYPCDTNWVFILTKTFWLSYHYLAPHDYQTGEFGKYGTDCTSKFIRACAALELASDLRTLDSQLIRKGLIKSVDENKNICECLVELEKEHYLPQDHYLVPSKYY